MTAQIFAGTPDVDTDDDAPICDLEYIGYIGSDQNLKIYRCNTHPHNFFFRTQLDQPEPAICDYVIPLEANNG